MLKINCLAMFALMTAAVSLAWADQSNPTAEQSIATDQTMFEFRGFGTASAAHSSLNSGDYVSNTSMPKGAGRSYNWSLNDSKIGAHVSAAFSPSVTAIVQVVSEYNSSGNYRPEVEWANVKYAFSPNLYVRVGRVAWPTFMDSETRDVGYSYPWVYPPVDFYHQLTIPSSDGVDAGYRFEIGNAENSIQIIKGRNILDRSTSTTTSGDMLGFFDDLEYGSSLIHLGYQQRKSSTTSTVTGITGEEVENTDISAGASYDPGNWFVKTEWIQRRSTYKKDAMYISAGYRVNKFTPYVTHSQNSMGSLYQNVAVSALNTRLAGRSQSTNSVGVRWDFMRNYDFKLQYDRVTLGDYSNGYLVNVPSNIKLYGTSFHVISAVVDFVF